MKKVIFLAIIIWAVCFSLPTMLFYGNAITNAEEKPPEYPSEPENTETEPAVYVPNETANSTVVKDADVTVRLLDNDEIKNLSLGDYICGVLAAEMSPLFPSEALKAQAVAIRTYTLYRKAVTAENPDAYPEHKDAEVCSDYTHCNAWLSDEAIRERWGDKYEEYMKIIQTCVRETDGMIVVYGGEPIVAVFHSTSSGHTESAENVWGSEVPYLVSVESPGEQSSPRYLGEAALTAEEFKEKFAAQYPEAKFTGAPDTWFDKESRSDAGSVLTINVGGVTVSGVQLRTIFNLQSANFTIETSGDGVTFHTIGYGHGVGLSQYGARELALEGKSFRQILETYYTGVSIINMSELGGGV